MSRPQGYRTPIANGPGVPTLSDPRFRRSPGSVPKRRHARSTVRRILRWALPLTAIVLVSVSAVHLLVASGLLRVREVVVVGNQRLPQSEVRSLVAGLADEQIFSVDLEHYRARLLESPWIADVRLTRVLPATIRIAVVERLPMAAARQGQQLYLVDKTGSIIGDYGPADQARDLPIVEGLMASGRAADRTVDPARAALAAALLDDLAHDPVLRVQVSEIDVTNAHDAVVLLDGDTAWLHVGDRDFGVRLSRYLETRDALVERFGQLDYVDMRFGERIFLRAADRGRREQKVAHRPR